MPQVKRGESERDYVKRCVPVLIKEGKEHDQAVAVCYGMWDEHQKGATMKQSRIFFFESGRDSAFTEALTLGQGLPATRNGQTCHYRWKEVLRPGDYLDKNGVPFKVTGDRIAKLMRNFDRAKAKGFEPYVPDGHTTKADKNYGFIVGTRKNDRGGLDLLHQFIGDEAVKVASRNKTSICTVEDAIDETGEVFEERIEHNALCPDSQLNNLEDFQPVLAASRAAAAETVVLQLAADEKEQVMLDISKLREAIGAKKEDADDAVIQQAIAKLGEGTKALELSRTSGDALKTEKDRADKAEKERDAEKARVLELSKGGTDPVTLEDRRITGEEILQTYVDRGQCTDAMAKIIRENFLGESGKPSLMLSRGTRSGEVGAVFKLLELNKALSGFQQTGGQPVPRSIPGANGEPDLAKVGVDQGKAYQEQLLTARGLK